MKVLVTGASGFLGSRVTRLLLQKGICTTALDLVPCVNEDCEFLQCDITDSDGLAATLHGHSFDSVIHLAGIRGSIEQMNRMNVIGTSVLAETLSTHCGSMVMASSCSVYGIPVSSSGLVTETDRTAPVTPYGCTMLEKERSASRICHHSRMTLCIARLFNLFGPGQSCEMMVQSMAEKLRAILSGVASPPLKTGPLHTERDLIDVDDAASALVGIAVAEASGVFNVGTGIPRSGAYVLNALQHEMGTNFPVEASSGSSCDVLKIYADITHIHESIGWEPEKSFSSTIRAVVEQLNSVR